MKTSVYFLNVAQVQNPTVASGGKMSASLFLRTSYPIAHVQSAEAVVVEEFWAVNIVLSMTLNILLRGGSHLNALIKVGPKSHDILCLKHI
jgi:hypothetical protein